MDSLTKDLRYSLRMLLKRPGLSLVIVLTLALGIGANTTIFSLVNSIFLRPLPLEETQQLVRIYRVGDGRTFGALSYPTFEDMRRWGDAFSDLATFGNITVNLSTGSQVETVAGQIVSANFFELLGARPQLGTAFPRDADAPPGAHPLVVLGHDFWQSHFDSDPATVGTTLTLNGRPYTIVGIAPEGFRGPTVVGVSNLWVPLATQQHLRPPSPGLRRVLGGRDLLSDRGMTWLEMIGRLKPGVSLGQARSATEILGQQLARDYPDNYEARPFNLQAFGDGPGIRQQTGPLVRLLLAAVGAVLLIACANVANLLLARAASRKREIGVRLALGASRLRVMRQLLMESLLLALIGGGLALLLTLWTRELLFGFQEIPSTLDLSADGRILAFTLGVTVATAFLFGLLPALQATRADVLSALKDEGAAVVGGSGHNRLRRLLVVTQVALSLVLLVGAGLILRSLHAALTFDPGYDADKVLVARVDLDRNDYSPVAGQQFYARLNEELTALPDVETVSLARIVPLSGWNRTNSLTMIDGQTLTEQDDTLVQVNVVGSDYFRTLGIPMLRGREFGEQDSADAAPVVMINDQMARRHWPGRDPVGQKIQLGPDSPEREIIGVVATGKYVSLREPASTFVYLPLQQNYESGAAIHIRAAGNPELLVPAVREIVRGLDRDLPVFSIQTLADQRRRSLSQEQLLGSLLGIFGLVALVLAAIGIYGVIAYSVSQRTREVGVRMALGARGSDILRLVVGHGMGLALVGVAVGLAASVGLARLTSSFLFGVTAGDPLTFGGITLLLVLVALLACSLPARRATRVSPITALRHE